MPISKKISTAKIFVAIKRYKMVPRNLVLLNKIESAAIICPNAIRIMYPFFKLKKSNISCVWLTSLYKRLSSFAKCPESWMPASFKNA